MNALEGENLCFREVFINVNKLFAVLLLPVYLFIHFFIPYCVVVPLFLKAFFYTEVVATFLFIPCLWK